MYISSVVVLEIRLGLETGPLFEGLGLILKSTAFLLSLVSHIDFISRPVKILQR